MAGNPNPSPETRFLPGNRFWEARSSHGRNPIFETAEQLEDACGQYFEWVAENPLMEAKAFAFQGVVTQDALPKMRAMTLGAMCMFVGIDKTTWENWRKERSDLFRVIAWAEQTIYQQKFEGASADLLNANIIARDLGLADKKDLTSSDGTMSPIDMTETEIARRIAFTLARAVKEQTNG